jgi:hypothetical protein
MKLIKAACVLLFTLTVLVIPATQAVSHGSMSKTVARDLGVGPFGPGGIWDLGVGPFGPGGIF